MGSAMDGYMHALYDYIDLHNRCVRVVSLTELQLC